MWDEISERTQDYTPHTRKICPQNVSMFGARSASSVFVFECMLLDSEWDECVRVRSVCVCVCVCWKERYDWMSRELRTRLWLFKFAFVAKLFSQILHLYGRSPVCTCISSDVYEWFSLVNITSVCVWSTYTSVNVQMNLLSKSFVTYLALKGSFSCMYTHMHNQITLLSKPFLAIRALMRSSTGMSKKVSLQTTFLRERFHAHRTGVLIHLDVKGTYTKSEFGEWVWWKWVKLKKTYDYVDRESTCRENVANTWSIRDNQLSIFPWHTHASNWRDSIRTNRDHRSETNLPTWKDQKVCSETSTALA